MIARLFLPRLKISPIELGLWSFAVVQFTVGLLMVGGFVPGLKIRVGFLSVGVLVMVGALPFILLGWCASVIGDRLQKDAP